ncbi:hypothetical protein D3C76_1418270 [compost metagenome]
MKLPGSRSRSGLGNSLRKVICPVLGSTLMSENSSLPGSGYGVPSSWIRVALAWS